MASKVNDSKLTLFEALAHGRQRNVRQTAEDIGGEKNGVESPNESGLSISPADPIVSIDMESPPIRAEMVRLICGWLEENGFRGSLQALKEEAGVMRRDDYTRRKQTKTAVKAAEDGNWDLLFGSINKLVSGSSSVASPAHKTLQFAAIKQHFYELVESGESQKSLNWFLRKIKPLESSIPPSEFQSLLYLLSCKSVADGSSKYPALAQWRVESGRRNLCQLLRQTFPNGSQDTTLGGSGGDLDSDMYSHQHGLQDLPHHASATASSRLTTLIRQGFSYQVLCSYDVDVPSDLQMLLQRGGEPVVGGQGKGFSKLPESALIPIDSISKFAFEETPPIIPALTLSTHQKLTAVELAPELGLILAGSSDGTVSCWSVVDSPASSSAEDNPDKQVVDGADASDLPKKVSLPSFSVTLGKHSGRVWALNIARPRTTPGKVLLASVGADGGVLIFDLNAVSDHMWSASSLQNGTGAGGSKLGIPSPAAKKFQSFKFASIGHEGDAFCVESAPDGNCLATGGVKGEICIWSLSRQDLLSSRVISPLPITCLQFSKYGSSLFVGSRDGVIRVVDVVSGIVTQTLNPPLQAEVTSISLAPSACFLAASYKNSTNRIWDLLTGEPLSCRVAGNMNTNKNFIRGTFSPSKDKYFFAASEDGKVFMWELSKEAASSATAQSDNSSGGGAHHHQVITAKKHQFSFHSSMVTDIKAKAAAKDGLGVMISCSTEGKIVICTPSVMPKKYP